VNVDGARSSDAGGSGGRPDERFPHLAAVRYDVGMEGVLVSVVANVNLTARRGTIAYVQPVTNHRPLPLPQRSDVAIRTRSDNGEQLDEFPVEAKLDSELQPEEDRTGLVDAILPLHAATRTIELLIGGEVVDTYRAGSPPPAARAVHPVALDGHDLRVGVQFDRALEDSHTYAVQVSTDRGHTWQTVGVGLKEQTVTVDRRHLADGHEVQVRVISTNGISSQMVTAEPFRLRDPNAPL